MISQSDLETRAQWFFDLSLDPMCIAGVDGYLKWLNPSWERVLGYRNDELLGRPLVDFLHPDDVESTLAEVARLGDGDPTFGFSNRYRAKDGSYRLFHWSGHCDPDEGLIYAVARDLTDEEERTRRESRVRRRLGEAQRLESLTELAGGVAHDFSNHLTSILGNLELALADQAPESDSLQCLESARRSAVRAAELCRQMQAYSGRGCTQPRRVRADVVIAEMEALLGSAISKRVELFLCVASQELPCVSVDVAQLQQVVLSLVKNASEAIDAEGGEVRVSCREATLVGDESGCWPLPVTAPGRALCIEVLDDGAGMDGATLDRMFDPFFTTRSSGRGLGLAAVWGIACAHGGAIEVESRPGSGTKFRLYLPTVDGEPEELDGGAARAELPGPEAGVILIVDDDSRVRELAKGMLERTGFEVLEASGGAEALSLLDEHREHVSLVLLDYVMPDLDGAETYQRLRASGHEQPVLIWSGHGAAYIEEAFEGLTGFIQKPFRYGTLLAAVRDGLRV